MYETKTLPVRDTIGRVCAGCGSSILAIVLTNPLDLLKSRLQITQSACIPVQSPVQWALSIVRNERADWLVKGLGPAISQAMVSNIIFYAGYSVIHDFVEPYTSSQFVRHFLAGGVSYLIGSAIRVPLEGTKCRQQICTNKLLPTSQILKRLWRENRLYTGSLMIVLRDVLPGGLYFAIFFTCKKTLEQADHPLVPALRKFMLGSSMGIMYWLMAYPFDLIRNVQQSSETKAKATIRAAVKSIWTEYGARGFYKGMGVTVSRTVFSSGISLSMFDLFLRFLKVDFAK